MFSHRQLGGECGVETPVKAPELGAPRLWGARCVLRPGPGRACEHTEPPQCARTQHTTTADGTGAGRPGGAEAGNTQHRVALRVPQGREIIGLGHFLKQSFTGSIVFKPVKQSGELGPTWLALSSFLVSCVRFY